MTRRLLLIDDELVPGPAHTPGCYMWYYAQALRDRGYHLTEVQTTDDALRAVADGHNRFDLIVLDVRMPPGQALAGEDTHEGGRTGILLGKRIRRHLPDTPILVLTASQRHPIWEQLKDEPWCRVLSKTDYTPDEVADEVEKTLAHMADPG